MDRRSRISTQNLLTLNRRLWHTSATTLGRKRQDQAFDGGDDPSQSDRL
jgi:hypothetical protein